ncbi:pyridoxal kinase [Intestinibaculum porci]|uniref:Pyridoxal kinase n=1 Tax=Intestinibaculum porci TaxID=2487118 RepID=A0A3G9JWM8_9FIRM|nr:pyridoxamine kinase [Intestinibaculum porci]BBH27204.1 pyridoxal kinase [Intestinibaculum porci]
MRQKRMALINDITGFGRCSIAIMAPILSVMKIQAVPIPTAILSTHTQFPIYYFDDYTDKMENYIQTYKDLHLTFDGIATGFLGSEKQVDIVIDFFKNFKGAETLVIVDPVMGDYGHLYKTYTPALADKMKELVPYADILTPNLTELCSLLNETYPDHVPDSDELKEKCERLAAKGPQMIVITGIIMNSRQIKNFIYDRGHCFEIIVKRIGGDRSGTGDGITSVIAGSYMNGHSFYESVKKACDFTSQCIGYCEKNNVPNIYGLAFEEYLSELGE